MNMNMVHGLAQAFGRFRRLEARSYYLIGAGEIKGLTHGSGAPAGDPGVGPRVYLDTATGDLYAWDGAAWAAVGGGGGVDTGNNNVVAGDDAATEGTGNVVIGFAANDGTGSPENNVVIGTEAVGNGEDLAQIVVIGRGAEATGERAVAVGAISDAAENGVAIGRLASAGSGGVAIGASVTAAADRAVIGGGDVILMSGGSIAIEVVGSAPVADPGEAGVIRFNTADNKLYVWTGAAWKSVTLA